MTRNAVQKVPINSAPAAVARSNVVKKLKPVFIAPEMSVRLATVQHCTVQALDNGKKSYENAQALFVELIMTHQFISYGHFLLPA